MNGPRSAPGRAPHFGGVNAACYAQVFELLLRLKGNYFWPAMWSTNFSLDGPGLQSAELADELGVVMSTSHHEPCMRSGEEYTGVRGPGSPYGDAWDFAANPEGITRFWRDGLRRNGRFENVITLGMRGERDTPLLGRDSDLRENIELLRRILKTQNRLIREEVNPDLARVPRQLVLFTEVEGFLYGTDEVPGLLGDPELDGVTLMLSDNNRGYTRTLPTAAMRAHNGGFGMYYHTGHARRRAVLRVDRLDLPAPPVGADDDGLRLRRARDLDHQHRRHRHPGAGPVVLPGPCL